MVARGDLDRHTAQSVFTVVARARPECVEDLRDALATIAADPVANDSLPLGELPGLHYASLVLHEADPARPLLVFEANADGPIEPFLRATLDRAADGVDAVWSNCVGYPAATAGIEARLSYLLDHVVLPGAYHVGTTGRSRGRITGESELRSAIADFVDEQRAAGTLPKTSVGVRDAIVARVGGDADLAWALTPPPVDATIDRLRRFRFLSMSSDRGLVPPVLGGLAAVLWAARRAPIRTVVATAAAAGAVAFAFRKLEAGERVEDLPVPDALLDGVERCEDAPDVVTNHLASLVDIKPHRRVVVRGVLLVIDVAARVVYTKGRLGSIPSIHFAHWSVVDDGRRLLFVSNYDGSWESYLDDFIEKAASGLSAVWSNTVNFPPARWLGIQSGSGGARRGPEFKRMARNSQSPTTIRFCAYPGLSVTNVQDNSALREGLVGPMDEEQAWAWLSRL